MDDLPIPLVNRLRIPVLEYIARSIEARMELFAATTGLVLAAHIISTQTSSQFAV